MKKIIGGLGSIVGIGGSKKPAEAAKPAEAPKGPIQSPLTDANMPANLRRRLGRAQQQAQPTLGVSGTLGGR